MNDSHFLDAWAACAARARQPLPDDALRHARRSWFDTVAVTLGGARERCTAAALAYAVHANGPGAETTVHTPLHPAEEAMVLGTAAHALDYDDVCMLSTCHPSTPIIAALLALLPTLEKARPGIGFDEVLAAYAVGTETMLRLGEWLGFRHYALGFHATGTLGVVGAAAACAHALALPAEAARAALSIAASSAGGLRANFGTDTKPLHVGFAASGAVRAVLLAAAGATASDDVWRTGRQGQGQGFGFAFLGGEALPELGWNEQTPWALQQPGFEHKRYPSCFLTHRLISGVLSLRARQTEAVRALPVHIDIELPKTGMAALKYPRPVTGLEGKFSAQYCAAAAWADGRVGLQAFDDPAVQRPALMALVERVGVHERTGADERLDLAPVRVSIRHASGEDSIVVDYAPGSLADPMSIEDLLDKWNDCAVHAGVPSDPAVALRLLDVPAGTSARDVLLPVRRFLLDAIKGPQP